MSKSPSLRLDRLLANLGYGSRREIGLLAKAGLVVLDGSPLRDASQRITATPDLSQRMVVDGDPLDPPPGLVLMMNKPLGVTPAPTRRPVPSSMGSFPSAGAGVTRPLSTIGRLDKETSGLLLLTDDGPFLHKVISPKSKVAKRYRVALDRPLKGDEVMVLGSGSMLLEGEDKPLLPVEMEVEDETHVVVTLHEGRYHQVRRMFAALGNHVTALHRDRIGGLTLPADLEAGAYRILSEADVAALFGEAPAA